MVLVVIVQRLHLPKCFEISHPLGFASIQLNSTIVIHGHFLIPGRAPRTVRVPQQIRQGSPATWKVGRLCEFGIGW